MFRRLVLSVLVTCAIAACPLAVAQKHAANQEPGKAVLWTDPGDIRSRDLFYGPGGKDGQPQPPFRFESEDKKGANPKFTVRDGNGEKWKVKLGIEAQPEVVATRLLWAVGYFTNTNYFVSDLRVDDLPKLSRGSEFADPAGGGFRARLQRKPGKNEKSWSWDKNPFKGTREFNGLRVMMALLRNWDLKDDNNAWYEDKQGRAVYYVSDVGASFGTTGQSDTNEQSKNNRREYRGGKFVSKVTPTYVSFNFPTHPAFYYVFNPPYFAHFMGNRWIGQKIPRQDVQWIASLLSQLTQQQIQDAFRAAGYTPQQINDFSQVLAARITELSKL